MRPSIAAPSSPESIALRPAAKATGFASPSKRGMTWKWQWKTTWPADLPEFCTMLTPSAPVACLTRRANLGNSLSTLAATSAGMSITSAHGCLGSSRAWPSTVGKASRIATACLVSKMRWLGIVPSMICLNRFLGSYAAGIVRRIARVAWRMLVRMLPS